MISVIVPIKGESPEAVERFRSLASRGDAEILVANGGGDPATSDAFRGIGARVLSGTGSRGARLHEAAGKARGEVLLFLHADSGAPEGALDLVRRAISRGAAAGAFSLQYSDAGLALRWVAAWANLRSRWLRLPYGDQGIFCRRDAYERSGGFRDLPICDDLDFVRRLKRVARLEILPQKTTTSARRYRGHAVSQVLRAWRVQLGFFAGVSPETLERWYNGRS